MDFEFGLQQNTSFDISDFTTNCDSFQEQDDQQHFLLISVAFFPLTGKYCVSKTQKPTNQPKTSSPFQLHVI